jgi:hypothetical protein
MGGLPRERTMLAVIVTIFGVVTFVAMLGLMYIADRISTRRPAAPPVVLRP